MRLLHGLLIMFFFFPSVLLAEDAVPTHSCNELTATGNSEYPPFLWRSKDAPLVLKGVNRLILDELSRRTGIAIRVIHTGPWSRAQYEVEQGRVDLMAGAFYTRERSDYMDYFTPVMLYTTSVVWQNIEARFPYHQQGDLKGKLGVSVINNSFGQAFDQFAEQNLNMISVASLSQALRMLSAKRVDYVLYEKNPAYAYASLLGLTNNLVAVSPSVSSEGLYLTLSKHSPCNNAMVKQNIAQALADMVADGFNDQAMETGMAQWRAYSKGLKAGS
ncbi:substrate-binding periplasmic protein [Marinomonas algarum]|uniref:Transporter substrate-binding domain-containing protein n=1 Tax=Marinomonas algarum TaxID=2883105 RepID=A0A9X1IMG8_9GAMM|nr:transporter substrate-binding domain-containing protein [Marinomonas algarum]MCB5161612.1 transporter substrate-binding domain-containing protein [Marinomonas algarum]